ncbi:MAG: hypothetical protein ACKVQJ_08010 [Pyrinomonadaceae bacterium]
MKHPLAHLGQRDAWDSWDMVQAALPVSYCISVGYGDLNGNLRF